MVIDLCDTFLDDAEAAGSRDHALKTTVLEVPTHPSTLEGGVPTRTSGPTTATRPSQARHPLHPSPDFYFPAAGNVCLSVYVSVCLGVVSPSLHLFFHVE